MPSSAAASSFAFSALAFTRFELGPRRPEPEIEDPEGGKHRGEDQDNVSLPDRMEESGEGDAREAKEDEEQKPVPTVAVIRRDAVPPSPERRLPPANPVERAGPQDTPQNFQPNR